MGGRGSASSGSKGISKSKIKSYVSQYDIRLHSDGERLVLDRSINANMDDYNFIKSNKSSFVNYLAEQKKAFEKAKVEREAKISAIEGLDELTRARFEWSNYSSDYSRFIDRGGIGRPPQKPAVSVEELAAKYPRAAAYLKAQGYKFSSNYGKSTAGSKALEDIINGRDYNKVLKRMEREWSNYANEQLKYD